MLLLGAAVRVSQMDKQVNPARRHTHVSKNEVNQNLGRRAVNRDSRHSYGSI